MSERIESLSDLNIWRIEKINELVSQYEDTLEKHTKTRKGILTNIKILEEEMHKVD